MRRRAGIDLTGGTVALAHVGESHGAVQLRGFAVIETGGDFDTIASELRQARRTYRFPRHAEVVAWPGDLRVEAVRHAGFTVERVISPAEALSRVARLHHRGPLPDRVSAIVCVHQDAGALAVVRDGHVLHESAIRWPLAMGPTPRDSELLRRYTFLAELTECLRGAFMAARKIDGAKVTEVLTCGSLPELRSLTMPLADEFDVEVETLDSASGIELRMKPSSVEKAQEVMAALRLAIVAGRRWHSPPGGWRHTGARAAGVLSAAAAAAVLAIYIWPRANVPHASGTQRPTSRASTQRARPSSPRQPPSSAERPAATPPAAQRPTPTPAVEAPARDVPAAMRETPLAQRTVPPAAGAPLAPRESPAPPREASAAREAPPAPREPPAPRREIPTAAGDAPAAQTALSAQPPTGSARSAAPPPAQAAARQPAGPPPAQSAPQRAGTPMAAAPRPPASLPVQANEAPGTSARPAQRARIDPPATRRSLDQLPPFSVPVTSIMWSSERQFAVVDGRILGVGDSIRGATIVEIRADAVIVRDASGRLRRAGLERWR